MKKVGILTLGCRVNQYESDAIAERLEKKGYTIVPFESECDLYLINTCSVTAESDSKSRKAIRRALREREKNGARVAVIGCFAQGAGDDIHELSEVDYLAGNRDKGEVADKIEAILEGEKFDCRTSLEGAPYERLSIDSCRYVKAYVKIEDGCNNFCSYCYVPFVRGRVRSRRKDDIVAEIKRLTDRGYKEIILTGIETSSYGEDLEEKEPLVSLVETISRESPVERLRFGSLHPTFFTPERLERLSSLEGVMPHFHLSVQSASSSVLSSMRRGYGEDELYKAVEGIRHFFPSANLSCDMICGFPAETEDDFLKSAEFIKKAEILHTHIFPYSRREGTLAASMKEVNTLEKHERARELARVAEEAHRRVFEKNVGKEYSVLAEFFRGRQVFGYTENFLSLSLEKPDGCEKGDIIKVKITPEMDKSLQIHN